MFKMRCLHKGHFSTTDLLLGFNVHDGYYGTHNAVENDLRFGANPVAMPGGATVPAANTDSNHWPNSVPAGQTAIRHNFRNPETSGTVTVVLSGGTDATVAAFNCTINSGTVAGGTLTVTPANTQPTDTGWGLDFTPGASAVIPKVTAAYMTALGNSVAYLSSFTTHVSAISGANGPLRTMKRSYVEQNEGVTVTSTAGAFPSAKLTSANRNTLNSGDWYGNDGTAGGAVNDGAPVEADINMCVAAGRPLWRTMPWNADNTYYDAVGDLLASAAINNGLVSYVEVANEVWNGGYRVFGQARYEAISEGINSMFPVGVSAPIVVNGTISGSTLTVNSVTSGGNNIAVSQQIAADSITLGISIASLGTGTGGTGTYNLSGSPGNVSNVRIVINGGLQLERYCEKVCQVMDRIKARFVAAGAPLANLNRVLAWQNINIAGIAGNILDYVPTSVGSAVKTHIDVFSTAPYLLNSIADSTVDATGNAFIDDMINQIDTVIDTDYAGAYTACQSRTNDRGNTIKLAAYEGGQSAYIDDATTFSAVQTGSRMYDLYMHMFSRLARVAPGSAYCNFCLPSPDFHDGGGHWEGFGILTYSGQAISSSTPKYNAAADFVLGKRKLIALTGTLSATHGATLGTSVGTLKRRTPGSTVTISSTPSGALAFADATAQILNVQVADATKFASAGSISWTVTENDGRATNSGNTTSGTLTIA